MTAPVTGGIAAVPASARRAPWLRIAAVIAAFAALLLFGRFAGGYLFGFAAWLQGLGSWGPVAFIAGYVVATLAFAPGSVLTLAAGALFGIGPGVLYVFIAAVLGSSGAFLVSRYLARPAIERRIAGDPRFAAIDRAIGTSGLKIVLLLRLSPVFPFNLLNYALGLTRVRFADYLLAAVGMLPGTLLYVYYGKLAGDVAALAGGVKMERGAGSTLLLVVGLVATVVVTTLVTRMARRALREATGEEDHGRA